MSTTDENQEQANTSVTSLDNSNKTENSKPVSACSILSDISCLTSKMQYALSLHVFSQRRVRRQLSASTTCSVGITYDRLVTRLCRRARKSSMRRRREPRNSSIQLSCRPQSQMRRRRPLSTCRRRHALRSAISM